MKSASLSALRAALSILEESVVQENGGSAADMDNGELRLALVDSIASLEIVRDDLFLQRDIARSMARPVHRVPAEVLDYIFRYALPGRPFRLGRETYYRSLIPLSGVCKRWRDQILSTPSLWTFMPIEVAPDLLSLALSRSNSNPLEIWCISSKLMRGMNPDLATRLNRFAAIVNPASHRWQVLTLIPHLGAVDALQPVLEVSLPTLTDLTLLGSDWTSPDASLTLALDIQAPNIRRLSITHLAPPSILNSTMHLEELVMNSPRNPPLGVVFEILRNSAQSLRRLELQDLDLGSTATVQAIQQLQWINLPELRLLSLGTQPVALIKAFMTTLRVSTCVELTIKTDVSRMSPSELAGYLQQIFEHHISTVRQIVAATSRAELRLLAEATEFLCSGAGSSLSLSFKMQPKHINTWCQQLRRLLGEGPIPIHLSLDHHVSVPWSDWVGGILVIQKIDAVWERGPYEASSIAPSVSRFLDHLGMPHLHNGSISWDMEGLEYLTIALRRTEFPLFKQMLGRRYRDFPKVAGSSVAQVQRPKLFHLTCRVPEPDEEFRQDLIAILGRENVLLERTA